MLFYFLVDLRIVHNSGHNNSVCHGKENGEIHGSSSIQCLMFSQFIESLRHFVTHSIDRDSKVSVSVIYEKGYRVYLPLDIHDANKLMEVEASVYSDLNTYSVSESFPNNLIITFEQDEALACLTKAVTHIQYISEKSKNETMSGLYGRNSSVKSKDSQRRMSCFDKKQVYLCTANQNVFRTFRSHICDLAAKLVPINGFMNFVFVIESILPNLVHHRESTNENCIPFIDTLNTTSDHDKDQNHAYQSATQPNINTEPGGNTSSSAISTPVSNEDFVNLCNSLSDIENVKVDLRFLDDRSLEYFTRDIFVDLLEFPCSIQIQSVPNPGQTESDSLTHACETYQSIARPMSLDLCDDTHAAIRRYISDSNGTGGHRRSKLSLLAPKFVAMGTIPLYKNHRRDVASLFDGVEKKNVFGDENVERPKFTYTLSQHIIYGMPLIIYSNPLHGYNEDEVSATVAVDNGQNEREESSAIANTSDINGLVLDLHRNGEALLVRTNMNPQTLIVDNLFSKQIIQDDVYNYFALLSPSIGIELNPLLCFQGVISGSSLLPLPSVPEFEISRSDSNAIYSAVAHLPVFTNLNPLHHLKSGNSGNHTGRNTSRKKSIQKPQHTVPPNETSEIISESTDRNRGASGTDNDLNKTKNRRNNVVEKGNRICRKSSNSRILGVNSENDLNKIPLAILEDEDEGCLPIPSFSKKLK